MFRYWKLDQHVVGRQSSPASVNLDYKKPLNERTKELGSEQRRPGETIHKNNPVSQAKVNSEVIQKSPETSRSGDISKTKVTLTYADALTSPPVRDAQGQNDHRRLTPSKLTLERGQRPSSLKGQQQ